MEKTALAYLPAELRDAVIRTSLQYGAVDEIRLRLMRELSLTMEGRNVLCGVICRKEDLEYTVERLCQGSMYSHAENIREGVITTDCGIRAGVCGTAVSMNGKVEYVRDITSVCIRIPHRIHGAADEVFRRMGNGGVLIYSPPGCGKTTILRELIPMIGETKRVAVIDSRYELCVDSDGRLVDVYSGYPRGMGMRSAIYTMSPQVIVCDEIMGEEDAKLIAGAFGAGVAVCASVHGDSVEGICRNAGIRALVEMGVFSCIYGRRNRWEAWCFDERYSSGERMCQIK